MTQGETETDILRNAGGTVSGVQAGAVLGIGRSTTLRMLKDGTFPTPVLRLGRQYRVPVASLRKLLDLPAEPRIDAERGRMSSPSHVMAAATHLLPEQLEAEQRPVKPDPTVERRRNPRRP